MQRFKNPLRSHSPTSSQTKSDDPTEKPYKVDIAWRSTTYLTMIHVFAVCALYLMITRQCSLITFLFFYMHGTMSAIGICAGAHRLWAHKSYKANLPLKILLMYMQTVAGQNSIYEWVRDHRVHHKFSETDADPHNAKRGFFFAHVGWLMCRKHEDVKVKGKTVSMADLEQDPVVMFQKKHYVRMYYAFCIIVPTLIPWILFGDTFWTCWCLSMFRYALSLNFTWLVNSAAHLWGSRPFDKNINPAENRVVSYLVFGEGFHNYHHTFPWDYKAAELGSWMLNPTTYFIDFFAKIGWAYDLKTVSKSIIQARVNRTGDGSYNNHDHHHHHDEEPYPEDTPDSTTNMHDDDIDTNMTQHSTNTEITSKKLHDLIYDKATALIKRYDLDLTNLKSGQDLIDSILGKELVQLVNSSLDLVGSCGNNTNFVQHREDSSTKVLIDYVISKVLTERFDAKVALEKLTNEFTNDMLKAKGI